MWVSQRISTPCPGVSEESLAFGTFDSACSFMPFRGSRTIIRNAATTETHSKAIER